jgi:uncharacterized protein YdaU (DUF1376 family)
VGGVAVSPTFPWFPWYPNDFMGAVRGWSTLERGGYREALDAQWVLDGLPADPEQVRMTINATPAEFRRIWLKIESKFPVTEDGKRRNLRLEKERSRGKKVSAIRSELGRLGAAKRYGNSYSNSHKNAAAQGIAIAMPSTSTSTITERTPDSEAGSARKRARPAGPKGQRARGNGGTDEQDPEVQRRRAEARALAEQTAAGKAKP